MDNPDPYASDNPYAAPATEVGPAVPIPGEDVRPEDEATRWRYLGRETSVGTLGLFLYYGCLIEVLAAYGKAAEGRTSTMYISAICAALMGLSGWGIRRFKPWARWLVAVFSILIILWWLAAGAIGVAVGDARRSVIGLANIVLASIPLTAARMLLTDRGAMVFTPAYRGVVLRTPRIRRRTGPLAWSFLALMTIGIVLLWYFMN